MHLKIRHAPPRAHEINMTEGKQFPKVLAYALPLMATGVLQLLFNAADMMVVGKFVGEAAFAAVGGTASLVTLLVNFFIGLSAGAGVVMSKHYGAGKKEEGSELLHTSMPLGVICGVIITVMGSLLCYRLLVMMDTPEECLPLSYRYLSIYFFGAPFNLVYNFGAAMLRATGDTVRPLIYLSVAGVMNVAVNLLSVLVFEAGVAGVAYATVVSQAVSAVLVVISLLKNKGFARLDVKKIRLKGKPLVDILRLGIPSGLQNSLFSLSNVIIQATINGFGPTVVAGNTAAREIEGFVYIIMNSVANTAVTAIGQNYGAARFDRIKRAAVSCSLLAAFVGIVFGGLAYLLRRPLVSLYTDSAVTAEVAYTRMSLIILTYFLCGVMDVLNNGARGMGYSLTPMIIVLLGTCALRIFWIYAIFPAWPSFEGILLSYPISWIITATVGGIAFVILYKRRKREHELAALRLAKPNGTRS